MNKSFFPLLTFLWYSTSIHSSFIRKWKAPHKRKSLVITQDPKCVKEAKVALGNLYTINNVYLAKPKRLSMKKGQILSDQVSCTKEQREQLNDILAHMNTKKQLLPQRLQKKILPNQDNEWNIFQVLQVLLSYRKNLDGNTYEYIIKKGWKPEQLKGISDTIIRHLEYNEGVIQSLYLLKLVTPFKKLMGAYAKYLPENPLYNEIHIDIDTDKMYLILDHQARQCLSDHPFQKLLPIEIRKIIYTYFSRYEEARTNFCRMLLFNSRWINFFKSKYPNKMCKYIKDTTLPPCLYKEKSAIFYWKEEKDDLRDEVFYLYGAKCNDILCFFRSKEYRTVKQAIDDGWMPLLFRLGAHLKSISDEYIGENQDALNPTLYTVTEERELPSFGHR